MSAPATGRLWGGPAAERLGNVPAADPAAILERAAAAASEAELRQLWTVWRRLTLARRPEPPPWRLPDAAPAE